jgi:hypothetical protein
MQVRRGQCEAQLSHTRPCQRTTPSFKAATVTTHGSFNPDPYDQQVERLILITAKG